MPAEFIDRVERPQLIHTLTAWVLRTALRQSRQWREAEIDLSVAVDISTRSLLAHEFTDVVAQALAEQGIPPGMLTREITENLIVADPPRTALVLGGLGELGVRISIDDFGTGYSSLAYLQTLPAHELKIDRSLVMQLSSPGSDAIVSATVEFGHGLGLRVVAEGVETQAVWLFTAALGCDDAQDYYVGRAVAPDCIPGWLAAWSRRHEPRCSPSLRVVAAGAVQGGLA